METVIRLSAALGIFSIMICVEYWRPRRILRLGRAQRWPINLGLAALNMVLMRVTIGSMSYISAVYAKDHAWGLLNLTAAPNWLAVVATLLLLDFAIYGQHILMHKWPPLWRLHQVHHTDLEFDATTAVRFHPFEIMLSMLYKVLCIILIGADPAAVITFEIILNGAATFNHGNVDIQPALDRKLRWLIITPDMHRIHHSTRRAETDSNYGFSISLWDRLCGTYIAAPQEPQTRMTIGLAAYRKPEELSFLRLLRLPFKTLRRD
ncbi:sterol desaturase family protein [Methylomicrobium sp. Wu6]|uniref:sterol desaturase family protein n=1 Tax=Methylomicrobium sp. Wu6 TaxID=3107928 RepID=UPI002DD61DA7|nr:sterol desaturase family protein [Methylomicrobium sp. Wu6]MEC4749682.1 sterol desaturase family protein [Methylomicrobium sp. Wu6]